MNYGDIPLVAAFGVLTMRFSRTRLALKYAIRNPKSFGSVLLFVMGAIFASQTAATAIRDARLSLSGMKTQGVVKFKSMAAAVSPSIARAGLFAHGGGKRGQHYHLHYEFTVVGRDFVGAARVTRETWEATRPGQPLEVLYLPSDPGVNRAGEPFWRTNEVVPFGVGLAACVGAVWAAGAGVRQVRRAVQLIAEGTSSLGAIERIEIGFGKRGRPFVRSVKYLFETYKDGERHVRQAESRGTVPFEPGEFKEGDVVLVAYDAEDPNRHEIDYFDARREDRLRLLDAGKR